MERNTSLGSFSQVFVAASAHIYIDLNFPSELIVMIPYIETRMHHDGHIDTMIIIRKSAPSI